MIISTPLNVPNLVPDDWDIFWDIWNKNSTNLVKVRSTIVNPALNQISKLGRRDLWIGMDIYQRADSEVKTSWRSPLVDIKQLLPNMYQQCLDLPFYNISCVRIVKSLTEVGQHSDSGRNRWLIRGMLYHPWPEQQWTFSVPGTNSILPLRLPDETNWFSFNDKLCHHGTHYDPSREKLLIIVDGMLPLALLKESQQKYTEFTLSTEQFN